jgi:EmrB/QacA subfamily drug resistance transporter
MASSTTDRIERHVWLVAAVVGLGSVMSILAVTIVNVALESLSAELQSPLTDIQWVATGYLLGMGAVIPTTAWGARRFGTRELYLASLAAFVATSVLCAVAWSAEVLIAARVLQGLAGGLSLPLGQMMLASAAGPERMGRVMSVIGVPMVLGPMAGPVLGGLLIDHLSWHWIFVINVPFGLAALALGWRLLPKVPRGAAPKLDVRGLVLLCAGVPLLIYGLSRTSAAGGFGAAQVLAPALAGVALIAAFALHALRTPGQPLLNVRLQANRGFAAASVATFCTGAALYGAMLLLPLYFQTVRGEDALNAGLLLIPQGVGAALAMPLAGRVTDRVGGGRVALAGLVLMALGTVPLATVTDHTSYLLISAILVVRGLGTGMAIMPLMAAAFATIDRSQIADATPQLNVLQRIGGSIGTAILTVVLSHQLERAHTTAEAAGAFGHAYWWAIGVTLFAALPTLYLALHERRRGTPAPEPVADAVAA